MTDTSRTDFQVYYEEGQPVILPIGDWTVRTIKTVNAKLRELEPSIRQTVRLDLSQLQAIDTAGAYILDRTLRNSGDTGALRSYKGDHENAKRLLQQIREACEKTLGQKPVRRPFLDVLEKIGRGTYTGLSEAMHTLSFFGQTLVVCARLLFMPKNFRATATVSVMEEAGLNAIPIIMLLTFFVGMVIAFIGATTLEAFNSTIFTIDLVGIAVFREFGVLITAIILAGRTNSAFTAQLGAMRMQQEVDAMKVLGLDPIEVLVAPRIIAMLIMVPLLSFLATLAGLFGGLIVCWASLDISPVLFANRLLSQVSIDNFWVGMSKAPVFAIIVALIGCRHGLSVQGSVQSLGTATTRSVVQALFAIIVIDALFALYYMQLGI